jgi:hypothetical protein
MIVAAIFESCANNLWPINSSPALVPCKPNGVVVAAEFITNIP